MSDRRSHPAARDDESRAAHDSHGHESSNTSYESSASGHESSNVSHESSNVSRESLAFDAIIRGRRSVRRYLPTPVPRESIAAMLEAARWAPSPHGRMPWRFAVLTHEATKTRLAEAMAAEWQRNLELDQQPPEIVATRLAKSKERLQNAPVLILACLYLNDLDQYPDSRRQQAEMIMATQSLGAAIQNLLLKAYQLGLDGGWMCAPLFCPEVVVGALDLDPDLIPHALITIGYAAADPRRRERLPLPSIVVRWEGTTR
jgi:coenzyme F420-0:L-glutamate ligase / coenzyme F420-1:gamma-L-glutamate ligase